ncbi:MAG: DUF4136 domain-containing protein [Bacteroidetes bacterium]|nr:MAG: DUF4136 domain-containing protein [Bacteroidota bacterium]
MKKLLALLIIITASSCAPIYVNYDYERGTDFNKYKTYNYYSDLETGLSELDTKRLLDVLDNQMQAKDFLLSETPDFYVNVVCSEYENNNRNTVGVGVGGGGRNVGGGISIGLPIGEPKMNRVILFEFIDEDGIGLFWQAESESGFNPNASPEQREARFKAVVEKVIKGFPPKK